MTGVGRGSGYLHTSSKVGLTPVAIAATPLRTSETTPMIMFSLTNRGRQRLTVLLSFIEK